MNEQGLYILTISVHGLIRGRSPELGRDPDTGGQVLYVLDFVKALARNPQVAQVDLLTRLVEDPRVDKDYTEPEEWLAPGARILRLPFGPRRYIRKESLWGHLDSLVDRFLHHAKQLPRLPDIIHSHYADAGYVAQRLSSLLGIPFIHCGHSLGQCKRATLLKGGGNPDHLEKVFHFERRIQEEEAVLSRAQAVVASTRHEISEQYGRYVRFRPDRAVVIPPGTDLLRFSPPRGRSPESPIASKVDRFLVKPGKPLILCICRPEPSKNVLGLIRAYGEDEGLREETNLLLVVGNHEDIRGLDDTSRGTWEDILHLLDRYDLFGSVAIPKTHEPQDIPEFYRLAAQRKGVYVDPAYTESFGLTLIEAAASGLPVVATSNGGPRDIVANCRNGLLVDVADPKDIGAAIREALSDSGRWAQWSRNGLRGVRNTYTWEAHVNRYLKALARILRREEKRRRKALRHFEPSAGSRRFLHAQQILISDLDATLLGDADSLSELMAWVRSTPDLVFGVATGRKAGNALRMLQQWGVPTPDVLISGVGSEIRYGATGAIDSGWEHHICQGWRREELSRILSAVPGLRLQNHRKQGPYKLSYLVNPWRMPGIGRLRELLHGAGLQANLIYSQGRLLDVLPQRASKGQAIRYLAFKWGLPLNRFLVAGDSGNDRDMLEGDVLGIVVGNHSPEVEPLRGRPRVYFASRPFAGGILEGLRHYHLRFRVPELLTGTHS
ncbi:MAG: HAD-IIB family hydrolase [Acidobacteria bacterium]|nr:HAD-IIB family hydrolase [Acidobacteriota bacterium]MBI3487778.1 HAD-IIB family hydrolase [Acidobacteriota bacterium]